MSSLKIGPPLPWCRFLFFFFQHTDLLQLSMSDIKSLPSFKVKYPNLSYIWNVKSLLLQYKRIIWGSTIPVNILHWIRPGKGPAKSTEKKMEFIIKKKKSARVHRSTWILRSNCTADERYEWMERRQLSFFTARFDFSFNGLRCSFGFQKYTRTD